VITPRKHRKFNWYSIHRGNNLNGEAIEVFLMKVYIPVLLPLISLDRQIRMFSQVATGNCQ
jgi:hypothetical protein